MRGKVVVPDTGDGGGDLRRHARAVIRFYAGEDGRIFAQFMAEAQSDPRIAEAFRERFLAQRRAAVKTIWRRGVARGDFRGDVDADVAMDMIFAPIVYRLTRLPSVIRDSVEGSFGRFPPAAKALRSRDGAPGKTIDFFLTEPAGVCYCFSELTARPARRFMGPGWRLRFRRNEKGVKPLKTNNCVKWSISLPQ